MKIGAFLVQSLINYSLTRPINAIIAPKRTKSLTKKQMIVQLVIMVAISMIKMKRNVFPVVTKTNSSTMIATHALNVQNPINFMIMIKENASLALQRTTSLMIPPTNAKNVQLAKSLALIKINASNVENKTPTSQLILKNVSLAQLINYMILAQANVSIVLRKMPDIMKAMINVFLVVKLIITSIEI